MKMLKNNLPSKEYRRKIELIFPHCPDCPNGTIGPKTANPFNEFVSKNISVLFISEALVSSSTGNA